MKKSRYIMSPTRSGRGNDYSTGGRLRLFLRRVLYKPDTYLAVGRISTVISQPWCITIFCIFFRGEGGRGHCGLQTQASFLENKQLKFTPFLKSTAPPDLQLRTHHEHAAIQQQFQISPAIFFRRSFIPSAFARSSHKPHKGQAAQR